MEKWVDRNLMKIKGEKHELLLWDRGTLAMTQAGDGHAGISSLGKALGPSRQQTELSQMYNLAANAANSIVGYMNRSMATRS